MLQLFVCIFCGYYMDYGKGVQEHDLGSIIFWHFCGLCMDYGKGVQKHALGSSIFLYFF